MPTENADIEVMKSAATNRQQDCPNEGQECGSFGRSGIRKQPRRNRADSANAGPLDRGSLSDWKMLRIGR
jgi:hypothetical protein